MSSSRFVPAGLCLATIVLLGGCVRTTTTKKTTGTVSTAPKTHLSLKAFGNEPNWTVAINHAKLSYSAPDIDATQSGSYTQAINGNTGAIVVTSSQPALKLSLTKKSCSDTMAGKTYPMTAVLEKDGNTYSGCAQTGIH